jgi:hypothetical protein
MSSTLDEQSDEELLRRYQDDATDNDGEPFMAIYMRYRDTVRAVEAAELSPADAENRVGAVFIQALNDPPQRDGVLLRERLLALARDIEVSDDWHPL